jgi:hypothetical protein
LHYRSHPLRGQGGDTLVNTARTPLLPPPRRLPAGLSLTYALKSEAPSCPRVTLARREICSKRVLPPAPSSHIKLAPPAHFQPFPRHTFDSPCKHSSTLQQYSTYFQLYRITNPSTTITMVAFKVLVAAALACVVVAHDHPTDSKCSIVSLLACSALCIPS